MIWSAIKHYGAIDADELDRRRESIQIAVERMADVTWERQRQAEIQRYGDDTEFSRQPIREHEQAHVILPAVSDEVAFRFRQLAEKGPAVVSVVEARRRVQPWTRAEVLIDRTSLPGPIASDAPLQLHRFEYC